MKVSDESIQEQPQAKRLRSVEFRTAVGARVRLVGIDAPPPTPSTSAKTIGLVEFPASTSVAPSLAEVIADAVVAKLAAAGASVTVTGAHETSPTLTASSALVPVPARAPTTEVSEPPPLLLTTAMASRLLGCSVKAIYHRVTERQIPSSCIVRSGRRLLFHRTKLLEAMDRRAGR